MSLSIRERPQGIVLKPCISATIDQDYTGFATINTVTPHGIANNDFVYVTSDIEDYNGFWKVHFIDGYHLFLLNPDGSYVAYIVDANITLCAQSSLHGWSCIHLPIIYTVYSNLFRTNTNDSVGRTILYQNNVNSYTDLTVSSNLVGVNELEYIELIGDGPLAGVYQVLEYLDLSFDFIINLPYNVSNDFSIYEVRKYYSNYHVLINVWAGLNTSHHWTSRKPYKLATTLKLIPDSNNECTFSINEILKSYINIQNNLLQATLPNSLDSFVQFYIETAESYDTADGYTITTYESSFTSDKSNLEGYAANSILDFKNQYSGFLTEYLGDKLGKFLTSWDQPTIFNGLYFDIGVILNFDPSQIPLKLKTQYIDADGDTVIAFTTTQTITNYGPGIYRLPLSAICDYIKTTSNFYIIVNTTFPVDFDGWVQFPGITDPWFWDDSPGLGVSRLTRLQQTQDSIAVLEYSLPGTSSGDVTTDRTPPRIFGGDQLRLQCAFAGGGSFGPYTLNIKGISNISFVTLLKSYNAASLSIIDEVIILPLPASGPTNIPYNTIRVTIEGGMTPGNQVNFGYFILTSVPTYTNKLTKISQLQLQILNSPSSLISETKLLNVDCNCSNQSKYISWMNQFGVMEYWNFTGWSEYPISIVDTGEVKTNIFKNWPRSYGPDANTINKQTFRTSVKQILIRSQHLTFEQLQAIEYIKSSLVVEIVNSRYDKRRILIDKDSFVTYKDNDKLFDISFTATYTDNIPVQKL